jgi:TATA-box binding protein (TBP) (component of TFIID and TFIIIB)
MDEIDLDWQQFCDDEYEEQHQFSKSSSNSNKSRSSISISGSSITNTKKSNPLNKDTSSGEDGIPKSNALYISTQTIISYLNMDVNLKEVFWKLPIIPYALPKEGIVKKQIKFNSQSKEELAYIDQQKLKYDYVDEYVINHIDNPAGRIKFKDVRKISIGISKKDITSYRCKKKSAFYNCFVVILRLLHEDKFKEVHVKVFNTGKLEIPGIQNATILHKVYVLLVEMLKPFTMPEQQETNLTSPINLAFIESKTQTVLINSNFNCGYYLKRDILNDLFKKKYNDKIRSSYDPCTYPGIQCEIYYNQQAEKDGFVNALTIETMKTTTHITKVSFMVFRTGSVLIVGKCSEDILHNIYSFLCTIFVTEYKNIHEVNAAKLVSPSLKQTRNSRLKSITVNM